jgi:hypothetical protein
VNEFDPCLKPATHQHQPTGVALCAAHWANAETLGGREAGQWPVGLRIIPFPDGWVELPQPKDEEAGRPAAPSLWVEPAKTAGGIIIEL